MAESLMESSHWVRVFRPPTEDEKITRGIHYEPLDPQWRPKTIILNRKGSEPFVCVMHDCIGGTKSMPAETITVLMSGHTFLAEERECADLSHAEAPKTPPMGRENEKAAMNIASDLSLRASFIAIPAQTPPTD